MFNPDTELAAVSENTGISIALLKAVYLRGVEEFKSSGDETSTATTYGCVRVQRFVDGVVNQRVPNHDADLVATQMHSDNFCGADINVDAQSMYTDILYDDAKQLSELFYPNRVMSVKIDDEVITLFGEGWTYELNTSSGDYKLAMQ